MAKPIAVTLRRQVGWLVVLLLALGAGRLLTGRYLAGAFEAEQRRAGAAAAANERVLADLTAVDGAVRAYQASGDPGFLETFRAAAGDYPAARTEALRTAPDDRTRMLVRAEDQAAQQWLAQFALPLGAAPAAREEADVPASDRGRELFDAVRAANTEVASAAEAHRRRAADGFRGADIALETVLAAVTLVCVMIVVRIGRGTRRSLIEPLGRLQDVYERWERGERDARAVLDGPPEARRVAEAMNHRLDEAARTREQIAAAHAALHAQKAYLDKVLDVIEVGVLSCDTDGNIVHLNRVARGDRPPQDQPRTIADLMWARAAGTPGADPRRHPLARALAGEIVDRFEMLLRKPDDTVERCMLVDARPLRDDGEQIIGAVCTGYDVTALREREADLAAFAGIAAHDLKTPLTAIASYTELLADELEGTTDMTVVNRIRSGVERMRRLTDDLLAYATARDAPLRPAPVDVAELVGQFAAEHVRRRADTLRVEGTLPVLLADPGMIRQLLENLIGNALKYTPQGRAAEITVSAAQTPDGGVLLTVADRGIGIPAAERAHVFTSFHRAHTDRGYAGTGLGLAICQRVVTRHGGTISAADNPGGGTRIEVRLPPSCLLQATPAGVYGRR